MEIKSSLLKYKEFTSLKNNIAKISDIDGKDKFRVKMVEYINDTSDNNDDMFFYEMLPFSRFLNPSDQAIAYTTPEHLIYLNAPGQVGEKVRVWDFIYCHECLHQLWDTFEVGEKIKKAGLEYNHKLLNIASDCVINDYLKVLRKKEPFDNGIFPETLKEQFNIDYDRKNDTQYSLYVKLLDVYKEHKAEMDKLSDKIEQQEDSSNKNKSNSQSNSNSASNSNSGGSSDSASNSNSGGSSDSASNSDSAGNSDSTSSSNSASNSNAGGNNGTEQLDANTAQKDADEAKKQAENSKGASQEQFDKMKNAAKSAQDAADKAKECASNGDKEGEKNAAKEARKYAQEAKNTGEEIKNASGENDTETEENIEDINDIRKKAEEIIKKYKDKLSGCLGEFLSKCASSKSLKREGLKAKTFRGISGWDVEMNKICKAFVKKKVFQKKRQYENTYSRIRRGSGFVKFGQPIDPGRKVKEDKMDITVAFYLDKSGSMSSSINNVFKAVFYIADVLKKYFGKDKIVNDTIFESYVFDTSLRKLPFGKKTSASGGTLSFNALLDHISKNTKDFLINVIITDAQFSEINTSTVKDLLDEIDGLLIFITNTPNETMEDISKKYSTKLNYILADQDFTLN